MASEPVSDCTPEKCERCDIPPHVKHVCQAFSEWKRQVGVLHTSGTPEGRALAQEEVLGLFAVSMTHALEAGYVAFHGDVLALLDRMATMLVSVVSELDPKHAKDIAAAIVFSLLTQQKEKGPLTIVKVH